MTKAELVEKLYTKWNSQLTKKLLGNLVDNVFDNVAGSIKKSRKYWYPGFGTFIVRNRRARKGRNPQTGEVIKIKASRTVGFRPATALRNQL